MKPYRVEVLTRSLIARWLSAGVALALAGVMLVEIGGVRPVQAAAGVTFTVSVSSAYLRASPSSSATPTYSVFQGQTYAITGRSSDSAWVALDFAGGANGTWIRASFGVIEGNLSTLSVTGSSAGPAASPPPAATTVAVWGGAGAAPVAGPVVMNLTITVPSTYVRDAPSWTSNRLASLFQGKQVGVVARDATSQWLFIRIHPTPGWVPAGVGELERDILLLPVAGAASVTTVPAATPVPSGAVPAPGAPTPARTTPSLAQFYPVVTSVRDTPLPPWIPVLTPRMWNLYWSGLAKGLDPRMFTIAGDCNSEGPYYLELVAVGHINTSGYPYVNAAIQQFAPSFFHPSIAVSGGATASSVLNKLFSPPTLCRPGETPFACELRTTRASIVFIMLGTGDHRDWENFEKNYRRLIETALQAGALPVVMTKPDALESQEGGAPEGYINDVIRRLAREYEVPLLDFWLAAQQMEHGGLLDEPFNDFHYSAEAMGVHVIATLQTLYTIWHG